MRKLIAPAAAAVLLLLGAAAWAAPVQPVTITMRDFGYTPAKVTLQSGVPAELTIVNGGKVTHEFMLYGMPKDTASMMGGEMGHAWVEKTNYFKGIQVTTSGGKERRRSGTFVELRINSGKTATLRFTPVAKGTFEFSCMIAGHYEAGQRGTLIVR